MFDASGVAALREAYRLFLFHRGCAAWETRCLQNWPPRLTQVNSAWTGRNYAPPTFMGRAQGRNGFDGQGLAYAAGRKRLRCPAC